MATIGISIIFISFLFNAILNFRTARLAEADIHDCSTAPCMNGGTCSDGDNNFTCSCVDGFTGSMCETEYGCFRPWFYGPALGYCYLWGRAYLNWSQARESCMDLGRGADLASIHSAEENAFVYALIRRFAWIGLNDQETEGVLNFSDGTPADFLNFLATGSQREDRDCVFVKHMRVNNWFFSDCKVNRTSVCQKVHELITTTAPATTTISAKYGCAEGWVHNPASGYCYFYQPRYDMWDEARELCLEKGAELASIHSAEENTFIFDMLTEFIWIGLNDQGTEGVYTNFTDGTPVDFTNFPADNYQNEHNDCVALRHLERHDRYWFFSGCNVTVTFLCKRPHEVIATQAPATTSVLKTTTFPATTIVHPMTAATSITTTIPAGTTTPATTTVPATTTFPATTIVHPMTAATSITTTTPAATTIPATTTVPATTTFPATTFIHPMTAATSITTTIPATTSTIDAMILIELLLFPNNVSNIDNIFRVNDTILVIASVLGSFQPLSSQILWSITNHLSGDSVQYTVYSEDAVLVLFTTTSIFTIEATVVGNSYNLTATANATVLPTTQILCPNHVYASREFWCALLTDGIVKHSNYTFCFESSEDSCSIANPRSWSLDDLPDALIDGASSMDGFLASFLNHAYSMIGTYEVTSMLFHTLASKVNVTVKNSCISSLTMFVKEHCDAPHPAVYLRALNIHISAHMELDGKCIDPMTPDFKWWIFTSTEDDDVVTAFENITHTRQVMIPSGTLPYGIYSLNLKAKTHLKTSGEVTGEEQIITWLDIQPSPLVAVIKGGASRSHGVSSNLIVDGSNSYDPDVPLGSPSDLTFLWYCVVVNPEVMYSSLDEAIQNTDNACFEDEGIMMNSTSYMIEVIANKLNADVTMNFWLKISKQGRIPRLTQQRIQLTLGLLPETEIGCISNCNMYIFTAERLVLHASCTNCDYENEDVFFQWSLESEHTSVVGDLSSQTTTGLDQPYLVIKPHTFDSISETGSIILRVTGYQSNSGGYAEFSLNFNALPTLGCCLVTPDEGYALQTDFTVTCFGFTDVDGPLTYEIILFSRVDVVDGMFVGRGEGFQLYEGSEPIKGGLSFPVGFGTDNHAISLQVNVRDCNMASTSVYISARVHPPIMDAVGMNLTQELLDMTLLVESNVNTLLAVGDTGQAAQLISALGSILNSIGDEDDTEDDKEGRETRSEIRSSLVDSVAAIPVESMTSLRQSSAALAVITHNKQEISTHVQVLAASTLSEMTSFLKSKSGSYTQAQENIESAGTILVEGLSNILSAAKETKSLLSNTTSQEGKDHKNLIEVAVSAINDIQDAIVAGKIPSEEATIITSSTLSIAVGSISRDRLAEATFRGSEDLGFRMPSEDVLHHAMEHDLGTTVSMKMSAMKWNPFSWGAGGESIKSSIVGIQLKADHILEFHDLTADIDVYLPMGGTLSADPVSVHITKNSSASIVIDHSSLPEDGALHLTVIAENEPMVALSICTARISISEISCVVNDFTLGVSIEDPDTAAYFTWTVPLVDLKAANGIIIRLDDSEDQPGYEDDNITLSVFMHTLQCNFWNEDQQAWDSTGCKVGPLSKPSTTHCLCNHLTTFFGSSIFVPPNQVILFNDAQPVISGHKHTGLDFLIYVLIGYVLYCIVLFVCVIGCSFIIRIYKDL